MHKKIALCLALMLVPFELSALEPEVIEAIKDALRPIQKTDQEIRQILVEKLKSLKPDDPEILALGEKQILIDAENQKIVAGILDEYGWPGKTDFGSTGPAETVWLVIQHADSDFKKKIFRVGQECCGKR